MIIKTKKLIDTVFSPGFISGVLATSFVYLLFSLTTGITGEYRYNWDKKTHGQSGNPNPDYPQGEEKNLSLVVKYISGGEIIIEDEKGEVIARSQDNPIKEGPLSELRNIKFITVTENAYGTDQNDQHSSLLDSVISPAMAAATVYEYHYIWVDNKIVACRKHRRSPAPHAYAGRC